MHYQRNANECRSICGRHHNRAGMGLTGIVLRVKVGMTRTETA
jgi:hypothetical protein